MAIPSKLLFLPGASGNTGFWQPLADYLTSRAERLIVGYPGFGSEPHDPNVSDFDGLVRRVMRYIDQPTAVIAQSMGGIVAVRAALERPDLVTHLVLSVTSGGIDMQRFGAKDWRAEFIVANPRLPDWFVSFRSELSSELRRVRQPVLLLWGDDDPISPVAVGQRLLELLPNSHLHVVPGGNHNLANDHASLLAPIVDAHLLRSSS